MSEPVSLFPSFMSVGELADFLAVDVGVVVNVFASRSRPGLVEGSVVGQAAAIRVAEILAGVS